jgi:type IV secretory pathway VirB4 component
LLAKGGDAAPVNRGGWLSKAITENYGPPKGFKSRAQLEQEAHERAETLRKKEELRRKKKLAEEERQADEKAKEEANTRKAEAYLASLTPQERERVENDAVKDSPFNMTRVGSAFRTAIIQGHVLRLLAKLAEEPDEE